MDPIVRAAASGSNAAWAQLVGELGPAIRGFACARGVADPDELTQDVFLHAASSIAGFTGDLVAFRSWLFTIAYRRVADDHRRRSRRPQTVPLDDHDSRLTAAGPESHVLQRETVGELLHELDDLSELERDVVLLRVVGELPSDEVARIVGKSPGNVRVIQTRALARIRERLENKRDGRHTGSVTNTHLQRLPS